MLSPWWTPRVTAKEVQPLTPEQARHFLDVVEEDRLSALFTVAVSLGLRQGEALGLRWSESVNLESKQLRVRYALQRIKIKRDAGEKKKTEIHLVETKSKKGRRLVDLPGQTLSALIGHRMRQEEERRLAGSSWTVPTIHCEGRLVPVNDFVFTTTKGTPLESRSVTKRFQRLLKKAGIPQHRYHDLRHTCATLLAVQGVHPQTIQAVLGWDEARMVDRYTHFVDEMRKDAADKMEQILRPVAVKTAVNEVETKVN
jgi:integrase